MRLREIAAAVFFLVPWPSFAVPCANVGELLQTEEPRVKELISHLRQSEQLHGITLCDGSTLFKGWVFLGRVAGLDPSQSVFLFQEGKDKRAVAWVSAGGKSLPVPACPYGSKCRSMMEPGLVLSGDVYTWRDIRPGQEVVIVWYPSKKWQASRQGRGRARAAETRT